MKNQEKEQCAFVRSRESLIKKFATVIAGAFEDDDEFNCLVELWDNDVHNDIFLEVSKINCERNPQHY